VAVEATDETSKFTGEKLILDVSIFLFYVKKNS